MKTHLIAVALFVVSVNTINAQKLKETEVPKSVLTSFQTHFKGVKADEWEKEKNGEYEAEFKMNKAEMSANFSADGTLKETEQEIASSALPKAVTEYVAKNYAGSKIEEAAKITHASGKITYEAELRKDKQDMELLFDDKGHFIREVVETSVEEK